MASRISEQYPWTSSPLIINAPMEGFAGGKLAAEVSLAGGLGFIGGSTPALVSDLELASSILSKDPNFKKHAENTLPIGIGFLPFIGDIEKAVPVVAKWKPKAVWLFAAKELGMYQSWAEKIREATGGETQIWIQLGSVAAALEVLRTAKPDVIVAQGADAGGHGFERGAGIISLVPEMRDAMDANGFSHIPIAAAGGVVESRGVAAALTLGAEAVVMGTRFLASEEIQIPDDNYRQAVLQGKDGGQYTVRANVFDELRGPNIWPAGYNGRAVVSKSYREFLEGVSIEELRKRVKEAEGESGKDYGVQGRSAVWAGAGIGLVNEVQRARTIVEEVREGAKKLLPRH